MRAGERIDLLIRRPRWTAGLFVILATGSIVVPAIFTTRVPSVFVVPKLAVLWALLSMSLALVAVAALGFAALPEQARPIWIVDVPVVVFVGLTVVAWAFSTDRQRSLYGERLQHNGLLTLLLCVGFFYMARLSVTDIRRLRALFGAVAAGAALVSAYAVVQRAGIDPVWHGYLPGGRAFSSIGQANALAAYLVLALPVSAALLFDTRRRTRAAVVTTIAAMSAAFVFSRSRGGYLGLLAALPTLVVGWRRELSRRARRIVLVVSVAVVVALALGALMRASSVTHEFQRLVANDSSVRFHVDAWRVAAEIVRDHPALGTGPETFPDVFPRYSHQVLPADRAAALDAFRVESAHNVYLTVAAGSGLPALIAYLGIAVGLLVTVVRAARTAAREMRIVLVAVLAATCGHLVTDAFMTAEITSTWLFWVLAGATLGCISEEVRKSCAIRSGTPRRSR